MLRRCLLVAALSWASDFVEVAEIARQSLRMRPRVWRSFTQLCSLFSLGSNKLINQASFEHR